MVSVEKQFRGMWPFVALAALGLAALACGLASRGAGDVPTVTILSPAAGSSVPVNEPVTVQASASDDGPGVIRIDLLVDEVTVDTFEAAGPQASVAAELSFTPTVEGTVSVSVVAFREDGTSSVPTSIALTVVGATAESPAGGEAPSEGEAAPPPEVSSDTKVEAEAKQDVPIRQQCGPGCPQIGTWQQGDTGYFLIRTTSPTQWWYWTDYLGENQLGCVYQGQEGRNFSLLEDDSVLPRQPEQGCLYCGDGTCSPSLGEACNTCEEDCGACCGNGACEPEYGEACDVCEPDCGVCPYCGDGEVNQDSEECDGGGCDSGYKCNDNCKCKEIPPKCGDGIVNQPSELCDGDDGCWPGATCASDCSQCLVPKP